MEPSQLRLRGERRYIQPRDQSHTLGGRGLGMAPGRSAWSTLRACVRAVEGKEGRDVTAPWNCLMERPSYWSRAERGAGEGIEVGGASSRPAPHTALVAI